MLLHTSGPRRTSYGNHCESFASISGTDCCARTTGKRFCFLSGTVFLQPETYPQICVRHARLLELLTSRRYYNIPAYTGQLPRKESLRGRWPLLACACLTPYQGEKMPLLACLTRDMRWVRGEKKSFRGGMFPQERGLRAHSARCFQARI